MKQHIRHKFQFTLVGIEAASISLFTTNPALHWTLPIDGEMVTNLMGITLEDGKLAVGLGRADGTLRIWIP